MYNWTIWRIAALGLLLLAGCGMQSPEAKPSASAKPIEISFMTVQTGSKPPEESQDYVRNQLLDKTGVSISRTILNHPDEYWNQINVRMAAGSSPDLFMLDGVRMKQYADQGLLLDLTPYLDRLKPMRELLGDELRKGMIDGKLYGIPKRPSISYVTTWIRQDWLDALKLDKPKTLDELMRVATAFTKNDPDGNGKDDTYGITGSGLNTFSPIFGAFGVGMPGTTYVKKGRLVNSLYDPDMTAALAFIKNMMDQGLVDPDILSYSGQVAADKLYEGKAGISFVSFVYLTSPANLPKVTAVHPNAKWVQIAPPAGPGGAYDGSLDVGRSPGLHGISKSVAKDPAKLDKMIDMLNYIASSEGDTLVTLGEEGRHWYRNEKGDMMRKDGDHSQELTYIYQLFGRVDIPYLISIGYSPDVVKFSAETPRIHTLDGYVTLPENYNPTDTSRYIQEELAKFTYGKRPLSEYDDFLAALGSTFGYRAYIDAAAKQLTDLGFVK